MNSNKTNAEKREEESFLLRLILFIGSMFLLYIIVAPLGSIATVLATLLILPAIARKLFQE